MNHTLIRYSLLLLLLATAPFSAKGQETSASELVVLKSTPTLTLELASRMINVAARRATELNEKVTIVIVGTDGLPLAVRRHEDSPGMVYEQAIEQAQTAWLKNRGDGLPLTWKQLRVGGIGVCGAPDQMNREIAAAALDVFNGALNKKLPVQSAGKELLKIILYVKPSEIIETATFYREAIGLQQLTTYPDWIEFDAGTANICLREKDKSSARDKATNFALYSGTREDVERLYKNLLEAGYKATTDINPEHDKTMGLLRNERTMTTFWIKDPAGNTVQIESLRTR